MVLLEPQVDRSTASKREFELKRLPRQKKLQLVEAYAVSNHEQKLRAGVVIEL